MIELLILISVTLIGIALYFKHKLPPKRKTFRDYFNRYPNSTTTGPTALVISINEFKRLTESHYADYKIINEILDKFSRKIFEIIKFNDGQLYNNDNDHSILVLWQNKFEIFDQNTKAINVAYEITEEISKLNASLALEGMYPIKFTMGISHNYKLANNYIHVARKYGVVSLFDESVAKLAKGAFIILELDTVDLDSKLINVFTVMGYMLADTKYETLNSSQHIKFLTAYKDRRFEMAAVIAASLRSTWNGKLINYYSLMISRCKHLRNNSPSYNWDGVYRL